MTPATKAILRAITLFILPALAWAGNSTISASDFQAPSAEYRPHTRWWWMGNALGKDDITWQLEQMKAQGIGGVEQITMEPVYERGNTPYLSDEHIELLTHAVQTAKSLGMEVSLNFGGPGWVIGGDWVPKEDRSKNMVPTHVDVHGPRRFEGPLPIETLRQSPFSHTTGRDIGSEDKLVALVAVQIVDGRLVHQSAVDLTPRVIERRLDWHVPPGDWRIMAFWLQFTNHGNALDHFKGSAMQRYCEHLGGRFREAFGGEFGKTVDSFFCDSFEVNLLPNGLYWSEGLLDEFNRRHAYDLTTYLPAVWFEMDDISPKIRYDVNEFLHEIGLEAFFQPFLDWCAADGVQGRIQPYGFPTDVLEGAGMTHIPEMEITAGEKDAVPWFDTRIGPKKYVASGAHLYGRNVVTTEAYTYLHWEPYRATLEELKIASDIYLRSGANKIYNHGYIASPEHDIAPSRGFFAAIHISHDNVWWPYYHHLSDYLARCCYMLRQGNFTADVAIYSPLANQWTQNALNARKWTRSFDWGGLGKLLIGNGYDFDLINDDVLQHSAELANGVIKVRSMEYGILILPNIEALPLESLERIAEYVRGGGVVIALEQIPAKSTGFENWQQNDTHVEQLSRDLFSDKTGRLENGERAYGSGFTYRLDKVIDRADVLDWQSSALDPFLNVLRKHVRPDFDIDFVRQAWRENSGLTFVHRRDGEQDIYFVTNVSDREMDLPVAFRVTDKAPWEWNPYTGEVHGLYECRELDDATEVPLRLPAYASTFIVFDGLGEKPHVTRSDFAGVEQMNEAELMALAGRNGMHHIEIVNGEESIERELSITGIPGEFEINGPWGLTLESPVFPAVEKTLSELDSWTESADTKHFSGTGIYRLAFDVPSVYVKKDVKVLLDLGDVGDLAHVLLNGQDIGTRWMHGQKLDVTNALKRGRNSIEIRVVNTLINCVSGLSELPPVPDDVRARFGDGLDDANSPAQRLIGFEPLPRSGLLGPVRLVPMKRVEVSL